jgi:transcriptional regulator with XRE-family HTH domain/tetratricopeptide (TPR) repeat protein
MESNEKLRNARQQNHWSQERAAAEIGIDRKTYIRWENGQNYPQPGTLGLVCRAFGLPAEDLGFTGISPLKRNSRTVLDLLGPASQTAPPNGTPRHLPTLQAGTTCTHVQEAGEATLLQVVAQEQYYFDLATQILEMVAWEYQWSSDVVQSKLDELRDTLKKRNAGDISRRQLIMLGVGGILLVSNPSVLVPEEIFPFVQQNIATCWKMSNGGRDELTHARQMVSSYMPTLTQLATQPSPHQKTAASQAAACYGLRSLLDYHLENLVVAEEDAKQFLHYSKLSQDPEWIVRAYVRYALIAYYRGQPEQALAASREANRYKKHVSPAVRFSLYKEQATYEAQIGLKDEANATLHLAYENLLQATHGQSRAYVDTNLYEWALWKGTIHYHLGEYKEAKNMLESVDPLNPDSLLPERVRTGLLNNLVFAELRTKERDLEHCLMLWERSSEGAKKLQSELRLAEVRRAHDRLALFFPHEPRVAALKEQIIQER